MPLELNREGIVSSRKRGSGSFEVLPFKDLKNILEKKRKKAKTVKPPEKKQTPADDEEFFRDAMREVREIREFREMPVYLPRTVHQFQSVPSDYEALRTLEEIVKGKRPIHLPDTPEYIEWVNRDYSGDIVKKLHEGQYAVQDCLDLHGASVEEAGPELAHFFKESIRKGYRCIKVIHGRGLRSPNGPVLKKNVVRWLRSRYRKYISAFVTARQCDGGLGALYILLR